MAEIGKEDVVAVLNRILESELAGVVRYTHYSFLVFGFGRIPIRSWLRGPLRPMVDDLLSEATVNRRGLFRPEEVKRVIEANLSGREDYNLQVFQLLTLELWQRAFIDG